MIRWALELPLFAWTIHYMPNLDYYMQCVVLGVNFTHGGLILSMIIKGLSESYPRNFPSRVAQPIFFILLFLLPLLGGVAVLSFPLAR